ncbi:hypothetical protein L3V23_05465 [Vibrio sp. A1-b2]|uniref:hypothetical protein n=1 Tax=Vibrio sp. A1-b2 TaxID=2912248 RepID=UPI001F3CDBAB|nr:hypothetical protein [Vibrio sp. A1-b2]MCF7361520.1 hypothetical protein [Vibrio sp. A1-b2]
MDIETQLEEHLVKTIKITNRNIPILSDEKRRIAELTVIEAINKLELLIKGKSTASSQEQQEALDALKEITKEATEAKNDIAKISNAIDKLAGAINKVEKVASKVVKYI